jgi:AcrR family transcriptional regulator
MREEIKEAALGQLAEGGPAGVSVNAIGRELGVSGPALYRYFPSRDALLTELVVDAYEDLAAALRDAVAHRRRAAPTTRLLALGQAYRAWALAQPHRYGLLFGPPVPGHDAHAERIVAASEEAMATLLAVLAETGDAPVSTAPPGRTLARELRAWSHERGADASPALALRAITLWARLHGHVSLEIGGNFRSMGLDADALFEAALPGIVA